jgi:hypothetical protein
MNNMHSNDNGMPDHAMRNDWLEWQDWITSISDGNYCCTKVQVFLKITLLKGITNSHHSRCKPSEFALESDFNFLELKKQNMATYHLTLFIFLNCVFFQTLCVDLKIKKDNKETTHFTLFIILSKLIFKRNF